jgi:hypothetical protein
MAQSEEDEFAAAEKLWSSGDAGTATQMHVDLTRHAQNPDLRLRSAIALLERLNPAQHLDLILKTCSIGIKMAETLGETETKACLLATRARNLAILNGSLFSARKNLRIAPGWLGFSLESDEQKYKKLTAAIESNDKEIEKLICEAQKVKADCATIGHILLSVGEISFQRYMNVKVECLRELVPLPRFVREKIRAYALDENFWYAASARQVMRRLLKTCEYQHCKAAVCFIKAADEVNTASAFYNLANHLRSANRFRQAKLYLEEAETIAKKCDNEMLLDRIPLLKERIRQRNRNVPDYAGGDPGPNLRPN